MQLIQQVSELKSQLKSASSIAFVPTMGNLHDGHLALVRQARSLADCVVVSIFVNPLQFGPTEDFADYPRTLAADCAQLEALADFVFAPSASEMYPQAQTVFIEPPPLANELCGAQRPGHFRGMATVVLKLLNLVQPQFALFGKKDYQQLHIIRQLVAQLNVNTQIIGGETVRTEAGLALSSRNQYLSSSEREEALTLRRVLLTLRAHLINGGTLISGEAAALTTLQERGWQVDYVSVRTQSDLQVATAADRALVILAAARLGRTRLIDNIELYLDADLSVLPSRLTH